MLCLLSKGQVVNVLSTYQQLGAEATAATATAAAATATSAITAAAATTSATTTTKPVVLYMREFGGFKLCGFCNEVPLSSEKKHMTFYMT